MENNRIAFINLFVVSCLTSIFLTKLSIVQGAQICERQLHINSTK